MTVQVWGSSLALRLSINFESLCLGESLSEEVCIWELRLDSPSEDEDEKGELSFAEVLWRFPAFAGYLTYFWI